MYRVDKLSLRKSPNAYLLESLADVGVLVSNVQTEHTSTFQDKRYNTCGDKNRNEKRGYRIEARPAVPLDEEGGYNDTHGP
jgi:hypothetical protein